MPREVLVIQKRGEEIWVGDTDGCWRLAAWPLDRLVESMLIYDRPDEVVFKGFGRWVNRAPGVPVLSRETVGFMPNPFLLVPFDINRMRASDKRDLIREDRVCQECGAKPKWQVWKHWGHVVMDNGSVATVDHIVPKALRGGNHFENLQLLCRVCNKAKGNKAPHLVEFGGGA